MTDAAVRTPTELSALAAVDAIIDDFGHGRVAGYFEGFAPEATFMFHSAPARLESRADYEHVWDAWERESGFAVRACRSTDRRIQVFGADDTPVEGAVAVFTHSVETDLISDGTEQTVRERESIVLLYRAGRWACIHEHLSAAT
jgi:Calcium/calmodulin dependent protein kinase II Association.